MNYMLDANVLRHMVLEEPGYLNISARIADLGAVKLSLSAIVAAELHVAINSKNNTRAHRAHLATFLKHYRIMPFDKKAAAAAGALQATRQAKGIQLPSPDYMIAGHALSLGRVIVTDNVKHFSGIAGLKVENWLRP